MSAQAPRPKIGGWPLTVAIAAILVFLFFVRAILPPFIVAAALAFILTPAVDWIHRRARLPRWSAAVVIFLLMLCAMALLADIAGRLMLHDVSHVIAVAPQRLRRLVGAAAGWASGSLGVAVDADQLNAALLDKTHGFIAGDAPLRFAAFGVTAIFAAILTLFLLIYFLISGRSIARGVLWLVPPEYRAEVADVAQRVRPLLRRYIVGIAVVVVYTWSVAWTGFGAVFRLQGAALLAVVVALLELIPIVGPATSAALVCGVALGQSSVAATVALVVFAIVLRLSIDQLIGPLILGRTQRLHPVVVIFAFLAGAMLFGVIGLLLAVPIAGCIKLVLTIYYAEPVETSGQPGDAARLPHR
ncbi:MAG TPA: AI-2E family transporter [Stellaceae bacterium]|nr:AI-2E family transporter [Stellaceae bacterium]